MTNLGGSLVGLDVCQAPAVFLAEAEEAMQKSCLFKRFVAVARAIS